MGNPDKFLEHFGVRGMKWGSRKSGGKFTPNTQKTQYKTSPAKLSNEELKRRVSRLETEKKYNELNANTISSGKKALNEIMDTAGKRVATTIIVGGALYGLKLALTGRFDPADAASYVTPRPKK